MSVQNYSESPPWMASPTNSDYNVYGSPALSPGSWNVASPGAASSGSSVVSPSSSSYGGSQSSIASPRSTTTHDFIGLPVKLGKEESTKFEADSEYIRRKMVAEAKAQKRLNAILGVSVGAADPGRTPASPTRVHPQIDDEGYALRQQAILEYKQRKREAKLESLSGGKYKATPRTLPKVLAEAGKERLATSTRKKKTKKTPEEDMESIQDYKTGLDIDREKEAKSRALSLMKELGMM